MGVIILAGIIYIGGIALTLYVFSKLALLIDRWISKHL